MMSTQLLEIQPRDLRFIFELQKQSTSTVRLINNTDKHVAFKVKTTSPKKYCVKPNVGVIQPKASNEFTVDVSFCVPQAVRTPLTSTSVSFVVACVDFYICATQVPNGDQVFDLFGENDFVARLRKSVGVVMQAQQSAPQDMVCKDKFLVQSSIVSPETGEDDITAEMFSKGDGKYVEEKKLKVILVSPSHSPELSPMNGTLRRLPSSEGIVEGDELLGRNESLVPSHMVKPYSFPKIKKCNDCYLFMHVKSLAVEALVIAAERAYIKESSIPSHALQRWNAVTEHMLKSKTITHEDLMPVKNAESGQIKDAALEPFKVVEPDMFNELESKKWDHGMLLTMDNEEARMRDIQSETVRDGEQLRLTKPVEEMKTRLHDLELKLRKAEVTMSKLAEERRSTARETEILQQELALLKEKKVDRRVKVGYPLLYVCLVAFASFMLGFLLRA
ncbi:hypothetical protein Dimus_012251 [Dionaea muscipula]